MFVEDYKYSSVEGRSDLNKVTICMRNVSSMDFATIDNFYKSGETVHVAPRCIGKCTLELSPKTLPDLKVQKVIYNKPATIVFWSDDTKTVVVCDKKDKYDPEKGFYIACAKKLFGNDYRAVGRMNKALDLAVDVTKKDK
jgi:hypothetical protein